MKLEDFEKAADIKSRIDKLTKLNSVLNRATQKNCSLGAVLMDCYHHYEVLADAAIPPELFTKFSMIISDEIKELRKEFESL